MDMKILFGSVVYQAAEKYLDDFFSSIDKQIMKDFSVLLLDDDMDLRMLRKRLLQYSFHVDVIHVQGKTPVQLRIELIRKAKQEGADLLVLGDCDDFFSNSRVVDITNTYVNYPEYIFFYNELKNEDGMKVMPELPKYVNNFKEIGEYNFLGLSNTALNINNISFEFIDSLEEYYFNIFDWYLFSRLLLDGKCGKKVERCSTIYRLHENNIAGIQGLNNKNIKREIEIKKKHYESLRKNNIYYEEKYEQYQKENYSVLKRKSKYYWWNLLKSMN